MKLSHNKTLITGGASGIGLGLTERFIQKKNTVILCGRRESVLQKVAEKHPGVITRVCDPEEVIEMIPPALHTDLGGPGLHDAAPPVSDFVAAVFEQMKAGKTELTFGFSAAMANASQEDLKICRLLSGNQKGLPVDL